MELRVLLQISFTPPVEAERVAIWLEVMRVSSSIRKVVAKACLEVAKSFLTWSSALVRLVGLWDFLGEVVGVDSLSSCRKRFFFGDLMVFCGEYWSFQSLTVSTFQKASRLCLRGGVGIFVLFFEGDTSLDFDGDAGGGVTARSGTFCLGGAVNKRGGENFKIAI